MMITRDVRKCALQALYQMDSVPRVSREDLLSSLEGSPGDEKIHEAGVNLAELTWDVREEADEVIEPHTPEWPTRRQPVIDRSILRLAYYEMTHGKTPPKVVINEAVELAKEYSTERSPMFINAVLDRVHKGDRSAADIELPLP